METTIKKGAELKIDGTEVSGYLVQYGSEAVRDLDGQFFSPRTFYGYATELPVFYHHGFNNETQKTLLGSVKLRKDETGIFVRGVLTSDAIKDFFDDEVQKAERYAAMIKELGLKSKLGWSSGTASHTLRLSDTGEIRQWILCEASLTPTPADWRNDAVFKSILTEFNELQEAENPSEIVKVGTELSKVNRDAMRKIHTMIVELNTASGAMMAKIDAMENPVITPTVAAPSKTAIEKLTNYLQGK